jgi:NitT/TauT family transport system substrate-binding protein
VERERSTWMQALPTSGARLGRRQFLRSVAGLGLSAAGLALLDGCAGLPSAPSVAQETLETTTIRLMRGTSLCVAPSFLAEDFLKSEGFTKVQYVDIPNNLVVEAITAGEIDMGLQFSGPIVTYLDAGKPLTVLAGVHVGCFVLFGTQGVNSIGDLKGKTVAITALGGPEHVFLSSMLAYVGLNPRKDINWITRSLQEVKQLFTDRQIDALLAFPPVAQELEAKKIGHIVVSSMIDKPWSQYFCCMVTAHQGFVQQNPVATKRALRAILKATDIAAREPEQTAKFIVDKGYTKNYDYALKAMRDIPYNHWRDYDPADTLRFFALRLRDAGMAKRSPDEIIAKGANWRFLNELKQELPSYASSAGDSGLVCRVG